MAAPVLRDSNQTVWTTTTTPKTLVVNIQAGDLIVVGCANAGGEGTFGTPTNNGAALTWTSRQNAGTAATTARCQLWTAVGDSTRSLTITVSAAGTAVSWGGFARSWGSTGGYGGSNIVNGDSTANWTVAYTTTAANSALDVIWADWNAVSGARTYLTTGVGTFTEASATVSGAYSTSNGYHADAGTAAAKTIGTSAPAGQLVTIAVLEILGGTGTTVSADTATATAAGINATGKATHTATTGAATADGINATGKATHTATTGAATADGISATGKVTHTATTGAATAAGIDATFSSGGVVATTGAATADGVSATGKAIHTATTGSATADGISATGKAIHTATTGAATAAGISGTFTGDSAVTVPHICPPFSTTGLDYDTDTTGLAFVTSTTGNGLVTSTTGLTYVTDTEDWC